MFSMSLIPALMLAPALFTGGPGGSPGPSSDGDGDGDSGGGGGGGSRPPAPPRGGPGGGIPLPDAQPARTRRRDHVRPVRTTVRRGGHPHRPARTPVETPADRQRRPGGRGSAPDWPFRRRA